MAAFVSPDGHDAYDLCNWLLEFARQALTAKEPDISGALGHLRGAQATLAEARKADGVELAEIEEEAAP